jgi:hypothetical protein
MEYKTQTLQMFNKQESSIIIKTPGRNDLVLPQHYGSVKCADSTKNSHKKKCMLFINCVLLQV